MPKQGPTLGQESFNVLDQNSCAEIKIKKVKKILKQ